MTSEETTQIVLAVLLFLLAWLYVVWIDKFFKRK